MILGLEIIRTGQDRTGNRQDFPRKQNLSRHQIDIASFTQATAQNFGTCSTFRMKNERPYNDQADAGINQNGPGENPVCHIYAPQQIYTNFQPTWKTPLEKQHLEARDGDPWLRTSNYFASPFGKRGRMHHPLAPLCDERRMGNDGVDPQDRERRSSNATDLISLRDEKPLKSRSHSFSWNSTASTECAPGLPSNIGRPRSPDRAHGIANFGHLLKDAFKVTSEDCARDPSAAKALFDHLLSYSNVSWTLYIDRESQAQEMDVRHMFAPGNAGKKGDLTDSEEKQAKFCAKGHWICVSPSQERW